MAITSGFFNSIDDDRLYNAEDMTTYFEGLVSDGVYESIDDALIVLSTGGMSVSVGAGRALVKLHWLRNSEPYSLQISAADVQYSRIDYIILKCDLNDAARSVSIEIKQGTPAANPSAPNLINTQSIKEMPLASIRVARGATAIYQQDIKDMRGSSLCGWVTGLIKQVDTSKLFDQYNAAYAAQLAQMESWANQQKRDFEIWFNSLTETLHVDTTLHKYQQTTQYTTTTAEFDIISEYEDGNILFVFIGGVLFVEGDEYTISDRKIILKNPIIGNNTVTQICIKNEIGNSAVSQEIDTINGEVI